MANPTSFVIKTIVRTIIQTGPRPTGASVATTTYSAEPAKTPISNLPVSAQHDVPIVTSSSRLYLVTNALPFPESASAPSVPSITVPATGVASGEGVYNRTTLIVCMIILGVIALAIGSWLMRCLVARRCPRRNLESLVHEEKGPEEAARRVSTLVLLEDTPSRRRSFVSDIGSVELAESVIGVASTTSLPASSSKTAIATDAYPRPVEARLRVRISPQEPSTAMIISASEVGRVSMGIIKSTDPSSGGPPQSMEAKVSSVLHESPSADMRSFRDKLAHPVFSRSCR